MVGLEDWLSVARTGDPDELRERILTGYRTGKPFTPYVPTITLPSRVGRVLDFGCGLGRNFPYLTSLAGAVVGFDLPPMIEQCRAFCPQPVALLTSDWTEVCASRYDLIFASLVLQHIDTDACRAYIQDFARIASVTYLLTRVHSDFNVNVLRLIADTGLFTFSDCIEVDHDERTHQLRVIGSQPFDRVAQLRDGGHYELLLHSR